MRVLATTVLASLLCLCPWTAAGVTIHVPGDRPTIQAGVNAASPGDTVLVSPGTYTENVHVFEPGIVILSESGPEVTTIQGVPEGLPMLSVVTFYWPGFNDTSAVLSGFTLRPVDEPGADQEAITCASSPTIMGNVIIGGVHGIYLPAAAEQVPRITHNTIVAALIGIYPACGVIAHNIVANCVLQGIVCGLESDPVLQCNDVWGNGTGYSICPDPTGTDGNISEDPLFCDPENGDYRLAPDSPCLHGYGCGLIGAMGAGCGGTRTQHSTWGLIKSFYR